MPIDQINLWLDSLPIKFQQARIAYGSGNVGQAQGILNAISTVYASTYGPAITALGSSTFEMLIKSKRTAYGQVLTNLETAIDAAAAALPSIEGL